MADICLVQRLVPRRPAEGRKRGGEGEGTYVDGLALKAFLQILVDSFVGDLAEQRKIVNTRATGFSGFENGAFDGALGGGLLRRL
jgi:hypothetical protein